jgi:D-alanyl-D-alanine carboxypeptidase
MKDRFILKLVFAVLIIIVGLVISFAVDSFVLESQSDITRNSLDRFSLESYPTETSQAILQTQQKLDFQGGELISEVPLDFPTGGGLSASCEDCRYFPVDKKNTLAADYIPTDLVSTELPGGGKVEKETAVALQELFDAMNQAGLTPKVNSAYRSYNTQKQTFDYWRRTEIAKGATADEAIRRANTYSAMPGNSEHQLGTTVDINCLDCSPFDRSENGNWGIWNFLEDNAHKYGFVISYPENMAGLTGYVYEPWHLRYVGKDIATEMYNLGYTSGNGIYITKYLEEKELWKEM